MFILMFEQKWPNKQCFSVFLYKIIIGDNPEICHKTADNDGKLKRIPGSGGIKQRIETETYRVRPFEYRNWAPENCPL